MNPPRHDDGAAIRRALRLVGVVGLLVSAGILTGLWAGINLEQRLHSGGLVPMLGVLSGLLVGLGLSGGLLWREARNSDRERPKT